MTILVTGATGFLGTNVVAELVERGEAVRASGMHGSETKYLDQLGVDFVGADVCDAAEVDALVEGMDAVIHVAGDTSFWKRTKDRQRAINVDGPLHVAAACVRHGVERMVHTSTLDVLGHDPERGWINETTGSYNFNDMGYDYGDTKLAGEQGLRTFAERSDLEVVYIYPGFMCGPYDFSLQLGRVFFGLQDGSIPGAPPGGSSFCHVRDVAAAHVEGLVRGRPGEAYSCAGWNLPTRVWFDHMADAIEVPRLKRTMPEWAMVAYGHVSEAASELTGKPPEMNPGMARYLSKFQYQDCTKAIAELDYRISPIPKILGDAIEWYRGEGHDL